MNLPDPVSEKGLEPELRRKFNQLLAFVRTIVPRDSSTVAVNRTASGVHLGVKPSARGSGGNGGVPRWG